MLREILALKRYGIEHPIITYQEAKRGGVELAVVAAVLEQETGGGRNVFGHDRDEHGHVIFHGQEDSVPVTKELYLEYKRFRDAIPGRRRMQGVGPMQLTWWRFQDEADAEGGCWNPRANIRVGIRVLRRNLARSGSLRETLRAYNGSYAYADAVLLKVEKWRKRLRAASAAPGRSP